VKKIARQAQGRLGTRLAGHDGSRKPWRHLAQAKTAVEAVGGFAEITAGVFGLADGVVATADRALDVAEDDIDPARTLDFGGSATAAGFEDGMGMIGIGDVMLRKHCGASVRANSSTAMG